MKQAGEALRYFSLVSTLDTPQHVAAQALRVDERTQARHAQLIAQPSTPSSGASAHQLRARARSLTY
ncbi:hypothetical protein [Paraburkholderia sp.]|uniref:hypothetical protein n=1 Tax=Paraburkholderia sp. TaxID=1926495 RepID=UPI00286F6A12|nr:hypothetical protein [Paraburkholderia sp.]